MSDKKLFFYDINEDISTYKFTRNSYEKIGLIGKGSFSKVFLVKKLDEENVGDSNYFCLKVNKRYDFIKKNRGTFNNENVLIPNIDSDKSNEISTVELRELMILKKISNHHNMNLVNLIDVQLTKKETWLLIEYLPTDLEKFFNENTQNQKVMNEKFLQNIAYQTLNGLKKLHELKIIHRDIKLTNIFFDDKKNIAKIGDFGLSRMFDYSLDSKYSIAGTFAYQPPEILLGSRQYSTSFDIWSLGCVLVEIVTNRNLFGEETPQGVLKLIYDIFGSFNQNVLPGFDKFPNSNLIVNLPEKNGIGLINYIKANQKFNFENEDFYDFIKKMLYLDPTRRMSAKDCLNHPWLKQFKKL